MNKDIAPVLDEISAVLKKHDMAGLMIVGNRTHMDWRMEVNTTWSCAWLVPARDMKSSLLRVRSHREDYPSDAAQQADLKMTIGTFVLFSDCLEKLNTQMLQLLAQLSKNVDFLDESTEEE